MRLSSALAVLAAALAVSNPLASRALPATRDVVLVGNRADGTVVFIDARSFRRLGVLDAIPDGTTPQDPVQALTYPIVTGFEGVNYVQDVKLSPDGEVLYVARGYLGDVAAFALRTRALLWRVAVAGVRADHLAVSEDGVRLFVAATTSDLVQVIDTRTHRVIGSVPGGDFTHTMGFSPDGRTLYNGSLGFVITGEVAGPLPVDGRHWLTAIDARTLAVKGWCELGAGVRPFVLAPDGGGKVAYLQLSYYNGVVKYDPTSCTTLARLDLPFSPEAQELAQKDYPNAAAQHGLAISPDGRWLCSAGTINDYAALISLPGFTLSKTVPVGKEPGGTAVSPDGRYCFVESRGTDTVSVVSFATRTEVARVPTGKVPQDIITARIPRAVLAAGGFDL